MSNQAAEGGAHAHVALTRAQLSMLMDALARDTQQDNAAANRLLLMLHDARRLMDAEEHGRAWPADAPIGYTVAAPDVTERDVLDALTHGHEADMYRSAIERDGLDAIAQQELRDMIDGGHLLASEDEAESEAGDVLDRDPYADPRVLAITAEDVAEYMRVSGWCEPEPRRLFTDEGTSA